MVKLEGSENHHSWSYCIKSWKVAMRLENINEGNYNGGREKEAQWSQTTNQLVLV
jgi:hypothetical protein